MTNKNKIRVAINGAAGRMGRRLVALAAENPDLQLVAALESSGNTQLGKDAGDLAGIGPLGVKLTEKLPATGVDVLVDFSLPAGSMARLHECRSAKVAMVIGTTGFGEPEEMGIALVAKEIPIVKAPNMSVGVNVLLKTAAQVAKALGPDYDIEIIEAHHRFKQDAPSGTALALARAIAAATGRDLAADACYGRQGVSPRRPGEIGIHAIRAGDIVGEHRVYLAALGERIELGHVATTRDTFARGALRAALWLAGRPAGLYSMQDVLGL